MIRDITIGQYYASESVVHRLDPRTKLFGVLVYIVILFCIRNPWWYLACFLLLLGAYRCAKVPFSYVLRGIRGISILLIFTFVFRMLCTPGEEIWKFYFLSVTWEGIQKAIRMTARIALMIVGASLLSYTTTPKSMADGLEKSLLFLEKVHVPIHDMSVIVMIAFRFIPIIIEELNTLMDAQAARGARFEEGNVFQKCRGVTTLLLPLFLSTVRRASDLAMAMEARGYTGERETSKMNPLVYSRCDRAAYLCIMLVPVFYVVVEFVPKWIR